MKVNAAKKIHYDSGPNMTPLVDIVMVILIFLMLTGSFAVSEHYLVSNLPLSEKGAGSVQLPAGYVPDEPIDIRVDSPTPDKFIATAGQIRTDNSQVLTAALTKLRQNLNRVGKSDDQIQMKIGPGRNVKYRFLIEVYEAALRAGYKKVAFATSH